MRPIIEFHEKNTFDKVGLYKIINNNKDINKDLYLYIQKIMKRENKVINIDDDDDEVIIIN